MLSWVRPKDIQKHQQRSQVLLELPSEEECRIRSEALIKEGFGGADAGRVMVSSEAIQDAQLLPWLKKSTEGTATGTLAWLNAQIRHPIHRVDILKRRQEDLKTMAALPVSLPTVFAEYEADMLWALNLPPLEKAWPLPLLFPQWWALRWINHLPPVIQIYQLYRIYGAPLSQFIYPLTLLLGPWWYVRTKLGLKISFGTYIGFIKKTFIELLRFRTGNPWEIVVKITTLVVYVGLYLYGWLQTLDISILLWKVRQMLAKRMKRIQAFITSVEAHWRAAGGLALHTWSLEDAGDSVGVLPNTLTGMYRLFKSSAFHSLLKTRLLQAYTLQGIHCLSTKGFTFVRFTTGAAAVRPVVQFKGMTHPMLSEGVRNPVSLRKHLILTGPNAAGKSTYVRGILANLLLAQTFGVAMSQRAILTPVRRIVSLMRVQDTVGSASLFEAECRRAMDLIRSAQEETEGPMVFFLDEPMQATPPLEGAATAMALLRYLSKFPLVRLIATTHYHGVSQLESQMPGRFQNISMEATGLDPIQFSYKLREGPCFQSIALEMLKKDAFPEELLEDAIKIKNKLYGFENNTNA